MGNDFLVNMKKYYKDLSHQKEAIKKVCDIFSINTKEFFDLDNLVLTEMAIELDTNHKEIAADIVDTWRNPPPPPIKPTSWETMPFNTQIDNPVLPHATCNSSSHWMFIRSCNPNVSKSDSTYVRQVMDGKFGRKGTRNPSIYWDVHTKGCQHYGVKSRVMSGNIDEAIKQACEYSIVTPTNILHRGHINNPTGGHVVGIAGYNSKDERIFIHDPYGELDYINGISDLNASGKYWVTKRNFLRRWQGNWTKKV